MKVFKFYANNSNLEKRIIEVKSTNKSDAVRDAQQICYKMGLCFLGTV